MALFQYNTMDKSKHTIDILEYDGDGTYRVRIDGREQMVDQRFMNSIIIMKNESDSNVPGKSMILG